MTNNKNTQLSEKILQLEKVYVQRKWWLYASSLVYTILIVVIFSWDYLVNNVSNRLWWVGISLALLVSINWWYWTMRSLASLIQSIYVEYGILDELRVEIDEIKRIIK
jgi:hypothetical protein